MRSMLLVCICIVMLTGCAQVAVQTEMGEAVDFNALRTYAWLQIDTGPGDDVRVNNPMVVKQVRLAVEKNLAKRGYTKGDATNADFLVTWFGAVESKVTVSSIDHFYKTYGYGAVAATMPATLKQGGTVRQFNEGTIVIDLIDPASQEMMWRGSGTERILKGMDEVDVGLYINKVVSQILRELPAVER
jgi:hypothetical protein